MGMAAASTTILSARLRAVGFCHGLL